MPTCRVSTIKPIRNTELKEPACMNKVNSEHGSLDHLAYLAARNPCTSPFFVYSLPGVCERMLENSESCAAAGKR
jgi:hypothetical protein